MLWSNNVCPKGQKCDVIEFLENTFLLFHSKLYLMTFNILFFKNFFPRLCINFDKMFKFPFCSSKKYFKRNKHLPILRFLNRPCACDFQKFEFTFLVYSIIITREILASQYISKVPQAKATSSRITNELCAFFNKPDNFLK